MDPSILAERMGLQAREKRKNRGLSQAELARIAGLTRQKVIDVEKGSLTSSMHAYVKVLGALDCDVKVVPATRPTLDEVRDLFD